MIEVDNYLLGKICKYCGSYYSPEGTWHKDKDGKYVCKYCVDKGLLNVSLEEPEVKVNKKNRLFTFFKR